MGDDVIIPLPNWVAEIGLTNPDIYFTDRAGRRNQECLSWGIDKERVLRGRTAVEVSFLSLICLAAHILSLLLVSFKQMNVLIFFFENNLCFSI